MDQTVLAAVPIDRLEIQTARGRWLIMVENAWEWLPTKDRFLYLKLVGNPTCKLRLRVCDATLEGQRGNRQWLTEQLKNYLSQPQLPRDGDLKL